jgi:O-succinylbenzoic acid--CoA ligase
VRARATSAGAVVVDAYGLSETWGGIVLDGAPIAGAGVMLGDDAEVLLRGPMVMRAYRLRREETAAAFTPDGWLRTGDIGAQDPDGLVRIVDRRKDLVISGGVNVSPRAVEEALADHPEIDDVAVVGVPDAEWGERVVAYVVPRDRHAPVTLADVRAFGRDHLGAAHLPRELVLVDAIPRTTGGKILRRELRRPG